MNLAPELVWTRSKFYKHLSGHRHICMIYIYRERERCTDVYRYMNIYTLFCIVIMHWYSACVCTHTNTYVNISIYVCIYIYMYIYIYTCIHILVLCIYIYIYNLMCMYIYIYMHVYTDIYIYSHKGLFGSIDTYPYIYIYIYDIWCFEVQSLMWKSSQRPLKPSGWQQSRPWTGLQYPKAHRFLHWFHRLHWFVHWFALVYIYI